MKKWELFTSVFVQKTKNYNIAILNEFIFCDRRFVLSVYVIFTRFYSTSLVWEYVVKS